MDRNIFREYDIRGVYPEQINEDVAYTIGRSYGSYIQEKLKRNICGVGRDNRLSSPQLASELIRGITDSGCNVIDFGLVTTPMYYYACLKANIIIGVMVTASHNPKDDNGFKFSFDHLGNARGEQVYDFRDYTLAGKFLSGKGEVTDFDPREYYYSFIRENIEMGERKLKVVLDCGNGTTSLYAKYIYSQFPNLDITMICDESDATFPNHHPDPSVPENNKMLIEKVKEVNADIGIGFDGDGDRVGFVTEKGEILPIDKAMIIYIRSINKNVVNKTYLYDVKCGKALEDEIVKLGAKPICYRTGNSWTRYSVNKNKIPFGGEYSGHLYFTDRWPGIDSGLYNGLRMLEILSKTDKSLTDLLDGINTYYNTPEIKVAVTDETKFKIVEAVTKYVQSKNYKYLDVDGIRVQFDDGWALVRASNTGPNLTLRFEAKTPERLEEIKKEFEEIVEKEKEAI
ncbi:MAG TPA: phosphomannomutase/phosphoglucomutase [Candidatus Coprovivens excrementavium]|nr:phosphomannomutase/phosphoglucomutase [Candidatus Coprovivens excrementavium]